MEFRGRGLSFSPNSAFSAARHDPSLHVPPASLAPPCCGSCTLPGTRAQTHTDGAVRERARRLQTAAGVSERQKWPIFSGFHLNNKQGGVLKWARGRGGGNWADKGYWESEASGLAAAACGVRM